MIRIRSTRPGNARFRAFCEQLEPRIVFNTTAPAIFNVTESVAAGQVISVQGDNFGSNPQLWIDRITDSSDTPNAETQVTNILAKTSQLITAELPVGSQEGLYAVMVKNTDTGVTGAYKFVNQARGLQFLDLADKKIYSGQAFRIAGHNLNFTATATTVQFREKANPANVLNAVVSASQTNDPFLLSVTAPTGLVDGVEYEVLVNNGYGGTYGQTVVEKTLTGTTGGVDHWGLGTSWAPGRLNFYNNVINVADFGAIANDGIDDRAAIQAAINFAAASVVGGIQGGVVQFGAGTFDVNGGSVNMKSRVVLQGAGRTLTKLESNTGLNTAPMFFGNSLFNLGVVDMAIEATANGTLSTWKVGGEGHFFQRARFVNNRKEVMVYGASYMILDDVQIVHTAPSMTAVIDFSSKNNFIIRNSNIQWADGSVQLFDGGEDGTGVQLENNTWSRSTLTDGAGSGYRGLSLGGQSQVAILNNTFNRVQATGNIPQNNDGETMLNEDIDTLGMGQVAAGTAGTTFLTVPTHAASKAGLQVTIVRGKGAGQTRTVLSGTGNTYTLTSAWDVDPDTTSFYSFNSFDRSYLVKGNTLENVPRGIWLTYASTMEDVDIVDNDLINGQSIYLRGDQRSTNRFNVQKNILVQGNYLKNSTNYVPAQIVVTNGRDDTSVQLTGNPFYNVMVRDNTIELADAALAAGGFAGTDLGTGVAGDGYFIGGAAVPDSTIASVVGVVADHNKSINLPVAYHVNTGSQDTVIFNSVNEGVGKIVSDTIQTRLNFPNGTHASVNTVLDWTDSVTTPPFVNVEATSPTATEGGAGGNFRITRTGTTGNLTVNYTVSGAAGTADYTQTFSGTATITNGNSSVDLPVTANDELVYFEPNEQLRLTLTPSGSYQIGNLWAEVTIVDNDVTNKILDVGFNGTDGGTGGATDIMTTGGTATLVQGSGSNTITVGNSNPMGGGNYATLNFVTGSTAPSTRITPSSTENSWAAMTTKPGSQWLLNGGFDFFVRRTSSSGSIRIMDLGTAGTNSWEVILQLSGSGLRMKIDAPGATDFDQTIGSMGLNTLYHLGVTMASDPGTGVATIKFFRKTGTGAIDTAAATDLVGTYTFNPEDTATNGLSAGAFNLGVNSAFGTNNLFDLDTFRMYKADPVVFSDISGESVVTVAATDASATETAGNGGTFTFTRSSNNTLKDLVVHYTLSGTTTSGDYTVSPTLGTVTILAGQTTATVAINPIDDPTFEGSETVVVNVLPDPMYVVGSTGATITIADNDAAGIPLTSTDIGSTGVAGSDTMDPVTGVHTHKGAGLGFSSTSDTFNFAYTTMTGDGTIIGRVSSITAGSVWARSGLMMRDSLATGSKFAFAGVSKGQGSYFIRRTSDNATATTSNTAGIAAPYWFKLTRVGNVFTAYRSVDGVAWTSMGSTTITMGATIYVGLATTSNNLSALATSVVDNLQIV